MPLFGALIFDKADSTVEKRIQFSAPHLGEFERLHKEWVLWFAGGLHPPRTMSAGLLDKDFFGNFAAVEAESMEAAKKLMLSDVFVKQGVWDPERLRILPLGYKGPRKTIPQIDPSSSTYKFLVYAPMADGKSDQAKSLLPQHLAYLNPFAKMIKFAAPIFSPESEEVLEGSFAVMDGENIDAVRSIIENDPFWNSGVWDRENVLIAPYAVRIGSNP